MTAPRTVSVKLTEGEFTGWSATARVDFSARQLVALESGKVGLILPVLETIITKWSGFLGPDGKPVTEIGDADVRGLMAVSAKVFDAIGQLPNR